tara:strand:+ start:175 stop:672 length:498 start_codon:yes stop_codon:yes gene_type:complete
MDNITKRINIVQNIIRDYFYNNDMKSSCLTQSYILYKYIFDLTNECNVRPILVKGYIINNVKKIYYGHFWVEYNDNIYDVATETYLLYYNLDFHNKIKNNMRILVKTIPNEILHKYKNIDMPHFEEIRQDSYVMCMENKMLEDMRNKVPLEIYEKIKIIHDKLIK